jgi:hypothetical protein
MLGRVLLFRNMYFTLFLNNILSSHISIRFDRLVENFGHWVSSQAN